LLEKLNAVTEESVLTVKGKVTLRPQSLINPNIISGTIEVQAEDITVETLASPLPFPLNDRDVSEDIRLKYRYLDLRSKKMAENLRMRHKMNQFIRDFLTEKEFTEVETPYISKSTPEGARDYLVPSRIAPGNFYALPQSPQQYKQLLMVGGMERYFQIARCFRDEDARGDRQPEFTQLDIEVSFGTQEEILALVEELFLGLVEKFFPEKILTFGDTIPRLSHAEVMAEHQSDKPDLRKDKGNNDELAFAFVVDFPLFEWDEKRKRYDAAHHPFTAPKAEFEDAFEKHPKEALSQAYDLVLNGAEIASGSIRINKPELQSRVFEFIGHDKAGIQEKFGHIIEAFTYGAPPHGGIAPGLDRIYTILLKEETIRDVIAFAKSGDGRDLMMNAPSAVSPEQLKELGIKLSDA
jgi:aspartyl-tRNA synthetase